MPPVRASGIFVERGGGDRRLAGQFVVASFAAAVISTPVMMWLPGAMGLMP